MEALLPVAFWSDFGWDWGMVRAELKPTQWKSKPMTPDEIEACWKDPRNWKLGVYYCKADPRVIVPKKIKWMGWTVNAARTSAIPVVLLSMGLLAAPVLIAVFKGAGVGIVLLTVAASITVVCLLSAYLSSTRRWARRGSTFEN